MGLHAGLSVVSQDSIRGAAIDEITKFGTQTGAGSIYASDAFAALLALHTKSYMIQYAGVISADGGSSKPFYNIDILN